MTLRARTGHVEKGIPMLGYELGGNKSVRHEFVAGGERETINIDLPSIAAQEMIQNDLGTNWRSYCKKFLAGKRILV